MPNDEVYEEVLDGDIDRDDEVIREWSNPSGAKGKDSD